MTSAPARAPNPRGWRREARTRLFTLPWRGRVGSHRAKQDARRGGVISQLGHCLRGETVTPPRRSFHSRRPRERAPLVSTPPGEGNKARDPSCFPHTTDLICRVCRKAASRLWRGSFSCASWQGACRTFSFSSPL